MDANALVGLVVCTALANLLLLPSPSWREVALHGVLSALAITCTALAAALLRPLLALPAVAALPYPPEFLLVGLAAGVTAAVAALLTRWRSRLADTRWWLVASNGLLAAAALPLLQGHTSFAAGLLGAFALGAAFALVLLVLQGLQQRLQPQAAPHAFRGLPLALLNAGFVALAGLGLAALLQAPP